MNAGRPLAQNHVIVCQSPDPQTISVYSPGLCRLKSGRLIATTDWGGTGVHSLAGHKMTLDGGQRYWQGQVYISDDHGITWRMTATFPFMHARPFTAGGKVYILGHANDLRIICSGDEGETWSDTTTLTEGERWHQAPCNVYYVHGCVYLVMEQRMSFDIQGWYVGEMAPVLMRARVNDDLTQKQNWTFASKLPFNKIIDNRTDCAQLEWHGIPFYACPFPDGGSADGVEHRNCAPIGWLETNVVQFVDPHHYWYDPQGKTIHLWMRAHTGGTGYACIAKVVEQGGQPGTGQMMTTIQTVPSGKSILYVPCPGGQMKFHILYDDLTQLYWLLSTQATDSMTKAMYLPENRYNLPNNQRRRLQLHFSKNMIDWCFAGMVAIGEVEYASRHYASMDFDGDDLVILSRSGDIQARTPHDGNLITFHRVENFRSLVY
ncbi:MAG: sialidase family protein [Anaerolineae bacterium]|nr:sialidase family protein [Anaerolineae bacterium]